MGSYEGIEAYGVGVVYDPCTMWLREGRQESYSVPRELDAAAVGYKGNEGCKSIHTSAVEKQASGQSTEDGQFFTDVVW
ncbi:hypothetical protein QF017_000881 [Pseudomonas laurylsulfatiphila]|uniref:hypothetical protein n=1 Tax=Pseudomonas laurylsulfatiphila TaxID=2011015 RepID=UPI003D214877